MKRLILWLTATILALSVPATAWSAGATVPKDPRITAAVDAWKTQPLYVDPRYTSLVDAAQEADLLERLRSAQVPVYVAVVPSGDWFQEKGDVLLLAGWLATANARPGIYLVMDGYSTRGVEHQIKAYAPSSMYGSSRESLSDQLGEYLAKIKVGDSWDAEPARTEPLPPSEDRESPPEKFTVGKAIGNGIGGAVIGLMGGALLAGVVLIVVAVVASQRGGRL